MHVTEQRAGPAVVFVHGFPELGYSWRHQLPALAQAGFRAIAPDMRGYGETTVPLDAADYQHRLICDDLVALLDVLGLARAVFVGHDWGGVIVWAMALHHPARVRAVAGINTPYRGQPQAPLLEKAPRRRRLWATDGSRPRRRAERPNHVWSYDFVHERTYDGRPLRLLTIVDEYTRECLSIDLARRLRSDDVLARLTALFVRRGPPAYLRSDNGPEFTAPAVRSWLQRVGVTTRFIAPGSPWENGSGESCTGTLRNEGLNPEIFTTLPEAQILIQRWRRQYNPIRPHSALDSRPPAPEALEIRPPHPAPWADRRGAALP